MGFFQVGRSRRRGKDRKPPPCFVYAAAAPADTAAAACGGRFFGVFHFERRPQSINAGDYESRVEKS